MPSFFYPIPLIFDLEPIREEIERIWCTFGPQIGDENRIALTHWSENDQNVLRDSNSKFSWPPGTRMSDFRYFNNQFRGGPIHRMYERLREYDPRVARLRALRLKSHRCYSFHNDEEIRYHFAVVTNPNCMFVVSRHGRDHTNMPVYPTAIFELDELEVFRIPANGWMFALDTNHPHTAINAGPTDRIHLVFDTISALNDRPMNV